MQKILSKKLYIVAILLILVAVSTFGVGIYARYVQDRQHDLPANSLAMTYTLQDGNSATISAGNTYQMLAGAGNSTISLTNTGDSAITLSCVIKIKDTDTVLFSSGSQAVAKDATLPVKPTLEAGVNYQVTITTLAPYSSTVTFYVQATAEVVGNFYQVTDRGTWVEVVVYTGSTPPQNLVVQYGTLSPDNTNDLMSDWLKGENDSHSQTIVSLDANSTYTFYFFKNGVSKTVTDVEKTDLLVNNIVL